MTCVDERLVETDSSLSLGTKRETEIVEARTLVNSFSVQELRELGLSGHQFILKLFYTRKNTQVVPNLQQTCSNAVQTTCQQDVFALLVPSLLTTCYKVVELNRVVTSCSNNLLSSCNSTICQQVASDNLAAT
jgi:hypothetical protein